MWIALHFCRSRFVCYLRLSKIRFKPRSPRTHGAQLMIYFFSQQNSSQNCFNCVRVEFVLKAAFIPPSEPTTTTLIPPIHFPAWNQYPRSWFIFSQQNSKKNCFNCVRVEIVLEAAFISHSQSPPFISRAWNHPRFRTTAVMGDWARPYQRQTITTRSKYTDDGIIDLSNLINARYMSFARVLKCWRRKRKNGCKINVFHAAGNEMNGNLSVNSKRYVIIFLRTVLRVVQNGIVKIT